MHALPYLLHARETRVWGGQGYHGQTAVIRARASRAKDFTNRKYRGRGWINELEAQCGDAQQTPERDPYGHSTIDHAHDEFHDEFFTAS